MLNDLKDGLLWPMADCCSIDLIASYSVRSLALAMWLVSVRVAGLKAGCLGLEVRREGTPSDVDGRGLNFEGLVSAPEGLQRDHEAGQG